LQEKSVILVGDNKTPNRMWSAKQAAVQVDNASEYDRLNFLVPIGGLSHAQMHAIDAILRAHWGPEAKPAESLLVTSRRWKDGQAIHSINRPLPILHASICDGRGHALSNIRRPAALAPRLQGRSNFLGILRAQGPGPGAKVVRFIRKQKVQNTCWIAGG